MKRYSRFDTSLDALSSSGRILGFMLLADLSMIWVARFIFSHFHEKEALVLPMDRTYWKFGDKNINILMLGVSYKNVTFPILFKMLDKRGNSNTSECIAIVQDLINSFGIECIDCLLADRESVWGKWLNFLNNYSTRYFI